MGRLFWIVCGVLLIGAIGLWGGGTLNVRGEVVKLRSDVEKNTLELHRKQGLARKGKLVNPTDIEEQKRFGVKLGEEEKALLGLMREQDMDLSDEAFKPKSPPRDSTAYFREWLTAKYEERNRILNERGIIFPQKDPDEVGDVVRWEEVRKEHIPAILRRYVISVEVFRALAEAKGDVKYMKEEKTKGGDKKLVESVKEARMVELASLRFIARVASGRRRGPGGRAPAAEAKALVRKHSFAVSFIAHYSVTLDFIRRLEKSNKGLFIVRSVRMQRLKDAGRSRRVASGMQPGQRYANTREHEAPVEVALRVELMEFPTARKAQ